MKYEGNAFKIQYGEKSHDLFINYVYNKCFLKIQYNTFLFLLDTQDYVLIWKFLLKNNYENYYNFIIIIRVFINNIDLNIPFSKYEKKIYKDMTEFEIIFNMLQIIETITKNYFNDMIKTDLDIINNKKIWVGFDLSNLYFLSFPFIDYSKLLKKEKKKKWKIIYKNYKY